MLKQIPIIYNSLFQITYATVYVLTFGRIKTLLWKMKHKNMNQRGHQMKFTLKTKVLPKAYMPTLSTRLQQQTEISILCCVLLRH